VSGGESLFTETSNIEKFLQVVALGGERVIRQAVEKDLAVPGLG